VITFSKLGNYGRLGNQLFQYAILLAVENERDYEIKIPDYTNRYWDNQQCLLNNFNISAKFLTNSDVIRYIFNEKQLCWGGYDPNVFNISDNTDLFGYFQNFWYYKKHEDIIIKELTPNEKILTENQTIINNIKNKYAGYEIVSLHLRRGDGEIWIYSKDSKWWKYFNESKCYFENKKVKFLVFTGGQKTVETLKDNDYIWCKNNLNGDEYIYFDYNRNTINDFTLMYLCDHHILSFGSTMSWWIGFLNNKKPNKIIISSKTSVNSTLYPDSYYPNNFILI
jgi:hypothetical protein